MHIRILFENVKMALSSNFSQLEDFNFVPVSQEKIIINSEEEDEGEEESCCRDEVPHVVVVKEVTNMAKFILVPEYF